MSSKKGSPSIFRLILIVILLLACLAVAGLAWGTQSLPRIAAREFGSSSSALSLSQRLTYSARLLLNRDKLIQPANSDGVAQPFEIAEGESVRSIAFRLERQGLIRDAVAFTQFAIYSGLDTSIQAGSYEISPAQNAMQVTRSLQDATPLVVDFNILPGWRLEEIAESLPTSGLSLSPADFLYAVKQPEFATLPANLSSLNSLDGFLFPGAYRLDRNISAADLVATFAERFNEQVTPDMRQAFKRHGLTLQEAVILASIVQREAVVDDEAPMIASVFYNRIEQGMKLDSDPTVQYALGYNPEQATWWTNPLSADDITFDSPYNTYAYAGLPPSPISSPGLPALRAVAYPAQSPYYYFRARCDGSGLHNFSVTYEEHLQNACP